MKNAARALGWATKALWILLIVFSITSLYSALSVGIGFGEPRIGYSNGAMVTSQPFLINNTGFYDITDLNVTTVITDTEGRAISASTTFVPLIAARSNAEVTHNVSLSLSDLNLTALAFEDTNFKTNTIIALKFARAIPVQMSTNASIPWGAPLYNLSIGEVGYSSNGTNLIGTADLSFENHSPFFNVTGTVRYELYNSGGERLGSGETTVDVPSYSGYHGQMRLALDDPTKLTPSGEFHVYFDTTVFSLGPVVVPYG